MSKKSKKSRRKLIKYRKAKHKKGTAIAWISLIFTIIFNFVGYYFNEKQIKNSVKQNNDNNIFQIATKITENRVFLSDGFEKYSQGQLLLSPFGFSPTQNDKNNSFFYVENTSKNIAQNVIIIADFNSDVNEEHFFIPVLQPNQKIYFYNPNNSDLNNICIQCSSVSGETLQFFYIAKGMLSYTNSLSLYSNKVYYDKKIFVNDLKNLTNEPQNDSLIIKPYNNGFKDVYKEEYLNNQNRLHNQYQL